MANLNETIAIEQLSDGGDAQSSYDWLQIRRESPAGTSNYVDRKLSAAKLLNGATGLTEIRNTFAGRDLAAGSYYIHGNYFAPAADANLDQDSPTQTLGSANIGYGGYVFVVVSAAGTVDTGTVELEVSGTSVSESGVRMASDTEIIIADIQNEDVTANSYFQTSKRWIGQVTFTLQGASGSPTTFSLDFNYGFSFYESANETDFTVDKVKFSGHAGAADTSFIVEVIKHSSEDWSYSAAAFVPGGEFIVKWDTTYNTEVNLAAGEPFNFSISNLNIPISGSSGEGFVMRITTGATSAVQYLNSTIGIK